MIINKYFNWIKERHNIYKKKESGQPKPWTSDPIFLDYKFCNPFRENDKTTKWFRENIRDPDRDSPDILMDTVIFRWFNYIPTATKLMEHDLLHNWDSDIAIRILDTAEKLITGAYVIKTPDGMNKRIGISWCIDNVWSKKEDTISYILGSKSLQKSTEYLTKFPFIGNFMSYEIVTDLRYTYLLDNATDILTWANVGPGAKRGLNRVHERPIGYNQKTGLFVDEMQNLLSISRDYLPSNFPRVEMRDIEHSLCEFDKYERIRLGEGHMKNRYNGRQKINRKLW